MFNGKQLLLMPLLAFALVKVTFAQSVEVNRANKTIAVVVTETVEADPEVAVIRVGYQNYGRSKEQAFEENVLVSNKIIQALLDAGIPKESIETETLRLDPAEPEEGWTAEMKAQRKFSGRQSWHARVPVPQAQAVVELAVKAGANDVSDVDWQVKDPRALEFKAYAEALGKARILADEMAKAHGAHSGDLLYISNSYSRPLAFVARAFETAMASVRALPKAELKLFPRKVSKEASVHAIFAME